MTRVQRLDHMRLDSWSQAIGVCSHVLLFSANCLWLFMLTTYCTSEV